MSSRGPRKTRFDITERTRLRATLVQYMERHGIGAPTLQVRLAEGTDRSPDLLPLKTLQRFLSGIGRTNDAFLIPCFEFTRSLPAEPELENFVREAADYFGVSRAAAGNAGPDGKYAVFARPVETNAGMRVFTREELDAREAFSLLHSHCVIERRKGAASTIREELVIVDEGEDADDTARRSYEGVALNFEPLIFIVVKNMLTRLPRAYWLREFGNGALAGYGMEAAFLESMSEARPYGRPVDFEFRPEIHEDQS